MRFSVAYRMAKGEVATKTSAATPTVLPPRRRPASQMKGSVAQLSTPDRARTAVSEVPKAPLQKWSR
jgi:hypothetical protein